MFARDDILENLDRYLLPPEDLMHSSSELTTAPRHAVLCGLGGLGKTTLAMEYAFTRRDKFDAVFWIRADERAKLEDGNKYSFQVVLRLLTTPRLLENC